MADNTNRVEALRLATIISDVPEDVVRRAHMYLAFLDGAEAEPKVTGSTAKAATKPAKAVTPPPPVEEPAEEPVEEASSSDYTIEQVRAALKEYRAIEGATAMLEIIKTHGGSETLTGVDASKFGAIMDAIKAE